MDNEKPKIFKRPKKNKRNKPKEEKKDEPIVKIEKKEVIITF